MLRSPLAYVEGYREARLYDKALAGSSIRHTTVGDPALDPVMGEISSLPPHHLHRFIKAGSACCPGSGQRAGWNGGICRRAHR